MPTAAVLPVKRFASAKQRLDPVVRHPLRGDLAQAMVGDVLEALGRCSALARTFVVTADEHAAALALGAGAVVVPDRMEDGQSAAAGLGIGTAAAEGFDRVLCVPGDCPALDPAEVEGLLDGDTEGVLLVPDRHGTGTNALLLAPPGAITPSFGPGSFVRHRELAAAAGVRLEVRRPPSLLLDVDTGEDLQALRSHLDSIAAAPRTRALLGQRLPVG